QVLLPAGRAYRFEATRPCVLLQQTILGPLSVEKWSDICLK
ncbi:hydroxyquinol 1,2-dioxygenase, partial [Pseudomonas aeruginosa]